MEAMKRPTVIETLAFLGLALTGLRSDRSGAADQAESGELTLITSFRHRTDVSANRGFGPVDTVFILKTQKKNFNQPHTIKETIPHD